VDNDASVTVDRGQLKPMLCHGLKVVAVQRRELGSLQNGDGGNHHINAPRPRAADVVEKLSGQCGRSAIEGDDSLADQVAHSGDIFDLCRTAEELIPSWSSCAEDLAVIDPVQQVPGLRTLITGATDEIICVEANHRALHVSRSS